MKEHILPVKIIESKNLINEKSFFKIKPRCGVHTTREEDLKTFAKIEGAGSYIIFDFGKEMQGGIRILTGWVYKGSCKVRVRFGESLGEVCSSIGYKNATNDHGPRDYEMLITASADQSFGNTGFRYLRIDLLEDNYINFRNVYCVNNILNQKPIYTYQGGDQRIKDIFLTAKRTVDLCASSGYIWDGVKRDRLVWVGDLAPEIMALTALYGEVPAIERSLNLAVKLTKLPNFMNDICTYSLWWIIILNDYYKEFKKQKFIQKHLNYLVKLIDRLNEVVEENGNFTQEARSLVDWPTVGSPDEPIGIRSIFLMGVNSAIELLSAFSLDLTNANILKNKLLKGSLENANMKQVIALKYFATGVLTDSEYDKLIAGGAKGLSTFMSYYILTAIASRNEKLAIDIMKDYYGAMLDRGATTFWEDFNIDWLEGSGSIDKIDPTKKDIHGDYGAHCYVGYRHSLCHGWSAGVVRFIKEHC